MAVGSAQWLTVVYLVCTVLSAQAMQCKGTAKYTLTFQGEWSNASHPKDFPSDPHFSSLVGCSHNASYVMWIPGEKATKGVKDVAETGNYTELEKEMNDEIASKNAHKKYRRPTIRPGTARQTIPDIEVNSEYPLVSFISMIAPSPDWFVGVHDFDLCNTTSGEWLDSRARDLPAYDAGTDSGPAFASPDNRTIPPENIHLLTNNTEGSFKGDKPVKRFGTFTFVKDFHSNSPKASFSNILRMSKSQYQPSVAVKSSGIDTSFNVLRSSTPLLRTENTLSAKPYIPTPSLIPTSMTNDVAKKSSSEITGPKVEQSSSRLLEMEYKSSFKPKVQTSTLKPTATVIVVAEKSETIISDPKFEQSSSPLLEMDDYTSSLKPKLSTPTLKPTSTIVAMKIYSNVKNGRSSTQQGKMEDSPRTKVQILNKAATISATFSSSITPTFRTTSGASSVTQFSFICVVFSFIFEPTYNVAM